MSANPDPRPVVPDRALPSGTITFVFTDIEGSTHRWERDPAAMQDAVRRHDAIMRTAIEAHRGHVFKTIGDAFCASFWRPADAVMAMLDAQRELAAQDFRAIDGLPVRAAIHTGTADERDADYFGPTVNRVARLLAVGHGGQVLVSGVTRELVRDTLPARTCLRELGEHRLKDLARPEHIYQLVAPDLRADFPPLRSLGTLPNNLPLQLTSFVGRETEIAEITALIGAHRLVTLVGSGGVGKTRTSLHVAANLLDGSGDGVWFIELAPLSSGAYIPGAVAHALGLTLPTDGDPVANLARALSPKHLLLVFDNCEHLVEPVARVIATLLRECPRVRVFASSRQVLGIAGEATYRMPSLSVPPAGGSPRSAGAALSYLAVALFVERARAVDNRFTLTDDNASAVADICRRLDGIPLAIELAAARVKILGPGQLRDRLDERFRVLTGGRRDVLPRQQTLRALIDWSYDLLDERERALFARLGIFVNGFTLEGAVAVGGGDRLDELDVFDVLASLVDKSLVLTEPQADALRYRLLESTRAYALEKLAQAGERDVVAGRHLRYFRDTFADLQADAERTLRTAGWVDRFMTELDDLRAALDGALSRSDAIAGAELLAALERIWVIFALDREGIARNETLTAQLPVSETLLRAKLLATQASFLFAAGKFGPARDLAAHANALARQSGDGQTLASGLVWMAFASVFLDDIAAAESALDEAEAIPGLSARLQKLRLEARAQQYSRAGDLDAALSIFFEMRRQDRAVGNRRGEALTATNIAEIEHQRGRTPAAIAILRETLPELRDLADTFLLSAACANLSGFLVAVDDVPAAIAAAREAIDSVAPLEPSYNYVIYAIEHLALVCALRDDLPRAAMLAGYSDAALARIGAARGFADTITHDRLATILRANLAAPDILRLGAEGAALTPEAAIVIARGVTVG